MEEFKSKMSRDQLLAELEKMSILQDQLCKCQMHLEHFRQFCMPLLIQEIFNSLKND